MRPPRVVSPLFCNANRWLRTYCCQFNAYRIFIKCMYWSVSPNATQRHRQTGTVRYGVVTRHLIEGQPTCTANVSMKHNNAAVCCAKPLMTRVCSCTLYHCVHQTGNVLRSTVLVRKSPPSSSIKPDMHYLWQFASRADNVALETCTKMFKLQQWTTRMTTHYFHAAFTGCITS
jgi:hypothetical protein